MISKTWAPNLTLLNERNWGRGFCETFSKKIILLEPRLEEDPRQTTSLQVNKETRKKILQFMNLK